MRPEIFMETNFDSEFSGSGQHVTLETSFPITAGELGVIRRQVSIRPDGRFLLSESGPRYHDRLRSYLATELLSKVDNPAVEIRQGEEVDPWVGQRIGIAQSAEEGLMMDAEQGAKFMDRARMELGEDAMPIIKSIIRNGISYPMSNSEHKELYLKCVSYLGQCIQDLSFRQRSAVRLSSSGDAYRENTWGILDSSPEAGIIIPEPTIYGPVQTQEVLPAVKDRSDNPWDKIRDYKGFLGSLSAKSREGLELVTGITPLGIRKVFAPAFGN